MVPALNDLARTGETREPAAPAKSQEAPVKSQAAPAKSQAARIKSQEVPAKSQAARIKSQEVPAKKSAGPAIRRKVPEEGHTSEGSGLSQRPFWRPQSFLVFLPADSCLFHPAAEDQGAQKQSGKGRGTHGTGSPAFTMDSAGGAPAEYSIHPEE